MSTKQDSNPLRIILTDERKDAILRSLKEFYSQIFDEDLSSYRAEQILRFFLKTLGPPVYNQAIQDARGFMQEKLEDLDATFYEKEDHTSTSESSEDD
jgi:uncharacterized protein (DUF2164 family)